jgi:hypothetical protein
MVTSSPTTWARAGLLALPVYGALLAYGTRKPQPDQVSDPAGWARFVSDPSYLVEHVLTNVVGTVLVVLGTMALAALLAARVPRLSLTGLVLSITGYVLFTVPAVISTFVTPAIGATYLAGHRDVMAVELPAVTTLFVVLALLLSVTGNVLLGLAVWRSGVLPRWAGVLWAVATVVFYLLGAALGMATVGASLPTQPVGGALMAAAGAGLAWAALRTSAAATDAPSDAPRGRALLHRRGAARRA